MLPVILTIGSFKLYSFGVFFAIALFAGLYWWWKLGRDEHLEETALFDTFFLGALTFFVVGRLGYVLLHLADFANIYRILGFLAFPGISFLAGGVGVTLLIVGLAYYQEWEVWKVLDNMVTSLGVVLVIGGIGGILNGTLGMAPDIVQLVWAVIYFAVVANVRKNFRFYSWYRNDRTVAPEGLPSLVAAMLVGVLYLVRGFIESTWKIGPVSYYTLGGVVVVLLSSVIIYLRSDRHLFKK